MFASQRQGGKTCTPHVRLTYCVTISLSLFQVDPSGRSPAFRWSVTALNEAAQGASLSLAPPNATSLSAPVLRVGQADMAPGARFRFTVAVGTFLGASATASVDLEVADAPLPSVRST